MIYATAVMVIGTVLFQLLPELFLSFFNPDEALTAVGLPALRTLSLSFLFVGASVVMSSTFQALGSGVKSLIVFIVRLLVPTLPLAWLFGRLWGLKAVWFALPASDLCGLILAAVFMAKTYKTTIKPMINTEYSQEESDELKNVDV